VWAVSAIHKLKSTDSGDQKPPHWHQALSKIDFCGEVGGCEMQCGQPRRGVDDALEIDERNAAILQV
jgi:hypothetical protein